MMAKRTERWMVVIVVLVLASGVLMWAADSAYARWVERQYRTWEAQVERNEEGVRLDALPYEAGEGDVAILFVHGFASSPVVFRSFVDYFAANGYACRAIRLPGFGETIAQASTVTREDWVDAVRTAAQALRGEKQEVWIIAHSLGGAVTLRVLRDHPELADGVVLLAPLIRVSDRRSPFISPDDWFRWGRSWTSTRMLKSPFPIDAHDEHLLNTNERDVYIPLNIYDELFALLDEVNSRPIHIEAPVMLALSERDQIVDSQVAREWFSTLTGNKRRLVVVEPAGHVLPLDTGWEELVRDIEAFMARAGPPNRDEYFGH